MSAILSAILNFCRHLEFQYFSRHQKWLPWPQKHNFRHQEHDSLTITSSIKLAIRTVGHLVRHIEYHKFPKGDTLAPGGFWLSILELVRNNHKTLCWPQCTVHHPNCRTTVETPTFGRPEVWPGAAMWQQRDPTLGLGGLDLLVQGPLVSPSAVW